MKILSIRRRFLFGLLGAVGALFGDIDLEDVEAANNSWIAGSGNWEIAGNWTLGVPPSTNNQSTILITNAATKTVTIDAATVASNALNDCLTLSNLTVQGFGAGINTLQLTNAPGTTLRILNGLTLGSGGALFISNVTLRVDGLSGGFTMNGGTVVLDAGTIIATNAITTIGNASVVQMTMSNGTMLASNVTIAARSTLTAVDSNIRLSGTLGAGTSANATGDIWVTGGAGQFVVTNADITVGDFGGVGQTTVSNGILLVRGVTVARTVNSRGTLTVAGGTNTLTSSLVIAGSAGATGSVWMTGGQLAVTNKSTAAAIIIGDSGIGQMTVSNGTVLASNMTVGASASARGVFTLAGGTNALLSSLIIAASANATGTVWVTGGQLVVNKGRTLIGTNGVGQLTVSNGTVLATNVVIGTFAGSQGTLTVAGGTLYVTNAAHNTRLNVNNGTLRISGGTVVVDQLVKTNNSAVPMLFSSGLLDSRGTTITNASSVDQEIGDGVGAATFHFNGGTHSFNRDLRILTNAALTGCGTLNAKVVVDPGGIVLADCGSTLFLSKTVTNNGTISVLAGTLIYCTAEMVNNSVIVATNGTYDFTAGFLNNGTLTISSGGTVIVDQLVRTNSGAPPWIFPSGLLSSSGTVITNDAGVNQNIGDGVGAATFDLNGGTHWINGDLRILTNSLLTGCGTLNAKLVVNPGGVVLANCGGTLTVSQTVTNNGTISAVLGTTISFSAPLVNNGTIVATNGAVEFNGGFVNNGTILTNIFVNATNSWTGSSGKWETDGNWSLGAAPSSADSADLITNGITKTVTVDSETPSGNLTISNLTVSGLTGTTNTLQLTNAPASTLRIRNSFTLSGGGALLISNSVLRIDGLSGGYFTVDGGDVSLNAATIISSNATTVIGRTASSQMTVSNGTWLGGSCWVGYGSPGMLRVAGGTNILSGSLSLGSAATGSVWVTGGLLVLTNSGVQVGLTGVGTLTVSNGTVMASSVVLAYDPGSKGTLAVAGGTNWLSSSLIVGNYADTTGDVWVTGGQLVATNGSTIIGGFGACQMTVSNGTVLARDMTVGTDFGARGTFTMAGGVSLLSSNLSVGLGVDGTGTVWVTDGLLVVTNSSTTIGEAGIGEMVISNGTVLSSNVFVGASAGSRGALTVAGGTYSLSSSPSLGLTIGNLANSRGVVWVTGGQLTTTGATTRIGRFGTGEMTVSNGTVLSRNVFLGLNAGVSGTLTIAGGTNTLYDELSVGHSSNATGTLWVTGGQLSVTNNRTTIANLVNATGEMTITNGTVLFREVFVATNSGSRGTLTMAGGTGSVSSNMVLGNFACTATGTVNVVGGSLFVTNPDGNAVLEVCSGTLNLTSGSVQVDRFVMTNSCAHFVHAGGTLVYGTAVLDPNRDDDGDGISNGYEQSHGLDPLDAADAPQDNDGDGFSNLQEYQAGTDPNNNASAFRITAIARVAGTNVLVTWTIGDGKTNTLQVTAGTANGSYSNNFADIFTVTNTVAPSTNYLDVGAATNFPARYYRVRLVP